MPQSLVYRLLRVGIRGSNNYHQTQTLALPINLENSTLSPYKLHQVNTSFFICIWGKHVLNACCLAGAPQGCHEQFQWPFLRMIHSFILSSDWHSLPQEKCSMGTMKSQHKKRVGVGISLHLVLCGLLLRPGIKCQLGLCLAGWLG